MISLERNSGNGQPTAEVVRSHMGAGEWTKAATAMLVLLANRAVETLAGHGVTAEPGGGFDRASSADGLAFLAGAVGKHLDGHAAGRAEAETSALRASEKVLVRVAELAAILNEVVGHDAREAVSQGV